MFFIRGEFAEISDSFSVRERVVPDKARRRIRQRILAAFAKSSRRIAAGPAGKFALDIIRSKGAVGPLMAVRAQNAATISIVQQAEITDELVLVRRHAPAKNAQVRVTISFAHVAENLVVTAVFLDDINDVLKHAWLTDTFGHRHDRLICARRQFCLRQERITQIGQSGLREFLQIIFRRNGNQRKRAGVLLCVEAVTARTQFCPFDFGADAFDVGDADFSVACVVCNAARKPAGGNQSKQLRFARLELENRNGILRSVADEKRFARFVEGQGIGLRAEQIRRILPRANCLHDFVRSRINDAQRPAGPVKLSASGRRPPQLLT